MGKDCRIAKKGRLSKVMLSALLSAGMVLGSVQVPFFTTIVKADPVKTITGLGTGAISNPLLPDDPEGTNGWDGSYVYYGTFSDTPVKYRVLDPSSSDFGGNTMLLDCDSVLFVEYLNTTNNWTWNNCYLNGWLNGNDFLGSGTDPSGAFTFQEREAIASSVKTAPADNDSGYSGVSFSSLNGEKIFLLDIKEAFRPSYGYPDSPYSHGSRIKSGADRDRTWWTRSYVNIPYEGRISEMIDSDGSIDTEAPNGSKRGVSPAFNVDLSSIISSSLIEGDPGKPGAEYKLTIKDDSLGLSPEKLTVKGSKGTFSYKDVTGDPTHVSLLITDGTWSEKSGWSNGAVLKYYGSISIPGGTGSSGSGSFTLPGSLSMTDELKVYLLAEKVNEGKATDYASTPVSVNEIESLEPDPPETPEEESSEEEDPVQPKVIPDKVPFTEEGQKYASSDDNFAPVASEGKITKLGLDFSRVAESSVKPSDLKMTVIKGSRFTTKKKLKDRNSFTATGGIKVKVNKKTLIPTISCKKDGSVTLTMEDDNTYTITFRVQKPKAQKNAKKISMGSGPVKKTIKDLFNTDIDAGELSIVKQKNSQAGVSDNSIVFEPKEKDSIKIDYRYLNKKYKITVKIK